MRKIKFSKAILEATDQSMANDPTVFIIGLGVPDPGGVFGTTLGLQEKYGKDRVMDMPLSENCMTGVITGAALNGFRPILTHQRVEFSLLSIDQIVNQAAKWYYMNAGQQHVPIVIKMVIGRGWGQGSQHAQSLESWFGHIPGLKVVMPSNPYDAKGLLFSAIEDDNPVIFLEHRWLHNLVDEVPEQKYTIPIGEARVARKGKDLTIVAHSYMVLEALRSAEILADHDISIEVIDLRSIRPLDSKTILTSVSKTKRLIVVDNGWTTFGVSSEIISIVAENIFEKLLCKPIRIGIHDSPSPSSRSLANHTYPRANDIINKISKLISLDPNIVSIKPNPGTPLDVPDPSFKGPF
ncbi:MAG: alpha-ketoacid dehydrogenase subunit beta [Candidatus Marinimicrobia bacterium]|nr:alpha-ketoacid dehydrogenase subunit beta [Candidatus Neomarinimicrobiota bacterium]|tara:strand:- start:28848 stop:29903 length:1056 start_codon:yes stop_codon:yes gene_type:complete